MSLYIAVKVLTLIFKCLLKKINKNEFFLTFKVKLNILNKNQKAK